MNLVFKISLSESNAMKGLAILMIMIHHFEQSPLTVDCLSVFRAFGPVGCGIFFFVSGYGLTVSCSPQESGLLDTANPEDLDTLHACQYCVPGKRISGIWGEF